MLLRKYRKNDARKLTNSQRNDIHNGQVEQKKVWRSSHVGIQQDDETSQKVSWDSGEKQNGVEYCHWQSCVLVELRRIELSNVSILFSLVKITPISWRWCCHLCWRRPPCPVCAVFIKIIPLELDESQLKIEISKFDFGTTLFWNKKKCCEKNRLLVKKLSKKVKTKLLAGFNSNVKNANFGCI